MLENYIVKPDEIERKSFEIIKELLGDKVILPIHEPLIKRVVHTTADLEYADILKISKDAVENGIRALKEGCGIVTDTRMAEAGINKKSLKKFGGTVSCFIDDEEVAKEAVKRGITRSAISMEKACSNPANRIFVIGNAPTALIRLYELISQGVVKPELVVGVPVGFVNVVESKELFLKSEIPCIITQGRKGGSNVGAAIINALMLMAL